MAFYFGIYGEHRNSKSQIINYKQITMTKMPNSKHFWVIDY